MNNELTTNINEFSLVAAPGAGKQTNTDIAVNYAYELREDRIAVIGTGDIFKGMQNKDPQYDHLVHLLTPESYKKVVSGDLVPDNEVIDIVDAIESDPAYATAKKKIRDGFPRTLGQAQALDEKHQTPKLFINLNL